MTAFPQKLTVGVVGLISLLVSATAWCWNHAPVRRIEIALRECDRATLTYEYRGNSAGSLPTEVVLTDKGTISLVEQALSLTWKSAWDPDWYRRRAYMGLVAGGTDPCVHVVLERRDVKLCHFVIAGNEMSILDRYFRETRLVPLESPAALFLLWDLGESTSAE